MERPSSLYQQYRTVTAQLVASFPSFSSRCQVHLSQAGCTARPARPLHYMVTLGAHTVCVGQNSNNKNTSYESCCVARCSCWTDDILFFSCPYRVIGDAADAKEFYRRQADNTRLRDAGLGRIVKMLLGECMGVHDIEWKRVRRPFIHSFSAGSVDHHHQALVAAINSWIESATQRFDDSKPVEVDLASLNLVPFDIFARFVYGHDLSLEDLQELHEMQKIHDRAIVDGLGLLAQLVPSLSPMGNAGEFQARWKRFNNRFLDKYHEGRLDTHSIFYQVAQSRESEGGGSSLSNEEVWPGSTTDSIHSQKHWSIPHPLVLSNSGRDSPHQHWGHILCTGLDSLPGSSAWSSAGETTCRDQRCILL